jgi:hypothetical protein
MEARFSSSHRMIASKPLRPAETDRLRARNVVPSSSWGSGLGSGLLALPTYPKFHFFSARFPGSGDSTATIKLRCGDQRAAPIKRELHLSTEIHYYLPASSRATPFTLSIWPSCTGSLGGRALSATGAGSAWTICSSAPQSNLLFWLSSWPRCSRALTQSGYRP